MTAHDPAQAATHDAADLAREIERLDAIIATWGTEEREVADAHRRAVEMLHGEALRRLIRALQDEPLALARLKEALADDVVYAVLRQHGLIKPSLNERIEAALDSIRPVLAGHGGDVRLLAVAPPRAEVQFIGTCDGCAASALTFQAGVRKAIQDACPEIEQVVQAKSGLSSRDHGLTSPFAPGLARP